MTIWFDMDGNIASLYSVPNWLDMLRAFDPSPYLLAQPMLNMSLLARYLHKAQALGYRIGVISWGSKVSNPAYDAAVTAAKVAWLNSHLPSVKWDEIHILPYGTPKQNYRNTNDDILFDDELPNREAWGDNAYDENSILKILASL